MSWMKRQGGTAPQRPDQQAYAAPQPYGNQQNMFPNYQGQTVGQQQQIWPPQPQPQPQQQPQQYNQQYSQVYQQQPFVNSTNQYFQQSQHQYNQNYANQNFDNVQQGYQQNYTHNPPPQHQNFNQNEGNVDGWEDNWGWGWEDSSKQFQKSLTQPAPTQPTVQPAVQPQRYNNANVIEESFASTNSWNWSMEEKRDTETLPATQSYNDNREEAPHIDNLNNDSNELNEPTNQTSTSNILAQDGLKEIKNLSDKEIVKEKMPNLALGKRINLENLTPQWSIESQMSQDSSDGPHTQSEGTYRSENQSRNSSKSSPGPNTDTTNFNYSQSGLNEMSLANSEWSKHSNEDSQISSLQNNNRRESYDELINSVQEMNIATNHENISTNIEHSSQHIENIRENLQSPGQSVSTNPSIASNQYVTQPMPPPPPVSTQQAPSSSIAQPSPSLPPINMPATHAPSSNLPPPPAVPLLPPTNFSVSASQNPFKNSAPFLHKNIAKIPNNPQLQTFSTQGPQTQTLVPQAPTTNLNSPAVVNKVVQQDRLSTSYGANLETTPDNSERPDLPQLTNYRSLPIPSQVPDNLEVAPQNDRNEYLQTAHLSSGDYGENTDFSRNIPPPGLRHMGVGQQEIEYNQNLNISGDEPPPGLARMVPGQQTEGDTSYNQVGDNYLDRQIDGQPTDTSGRPYRQADGQQTADNYNQSNRGGDRRPVGLDRMVPGEPSNDEYQQYQSANFTGAPEHRVVTGVDHDYPISSDAGPSDIREQNVDGSDYTEPPPRNPSRSVIGAREASNATSPDFSLSMDDQQREITMEGENLQDLSTIAYNGSNSNTADVSKDRNHDAADASGYASNNSRRQSLNRVTSGEDSERDRAYKASPRKDRDKQKSSDRERDRERDRDRDRDRDRERERDKDRGRYSRGDRKHDRESERRSGRDERRDRREREASPESRRHRRSTRSHRYETEDTDYYSDRERDRRQYREGSYTSTKPPRGEDMERRRYTALERERRHEEERARRGDRPRDRDRDRDRFERRYRDIDPRKYASLARDKAEDDRRKVVTFSGDAKSDSSKSKGETYSSGSRAGSREATATDEDTEEPRRRAPRDERRRHRHHHYYEGYGTTGAGAGGQGAWDALEAQRRQYEYYERLRRTDPAAYMRIYKQLVHPSLYANQLYDGYGGAGYERGAEERGSVHSGRSSANGLKPADTYYARGRDAASLRTDCSDRELTTDMSLNLHLEESTVRSERMTPFKYSTAHVKGVLCGGALVVVSAGYPVDGRAPPLQLLPLSRLLQRDPQVQELAAYPGPLVKGVSHKKSVVEYCEARVRAASGRDAVGYALLWELLALLLRQNGVVVGSDIAELLMKNTKQFEYKVPSARNTDCGGGSSVSGEGELEQDVCFPPAPTDIQPEKELVKPVVDEKEALERFREYLIYGNRQEALEWAMQCGLWGHALQLAAHGERRARAAVCARFLAALPPADPLHSLYAALALRPPPAATCVSDERWGDWRPHAAIILSNPSSKPEQDRRTLTQLGDTLNARGLLYAAQFCYVSAGVPFGAHPLAPHRVAPPAHAAPTPPPRLALLLADSRASTLPSFATDEAIFATEIYEYALSLSQDYVLEELTVYKLVLASRLVDAGQCERALRYAEAAARAVTRAPRNYSPALVAAIAALADKLKYYDAALQEEGGEEAEDGSGASEPSPRHQQWLRDVQAVALHLSAEASQQNTPQHQVDTTYVNNSQYATWGDQTLQQAQASQQYAEPVEDTTDYSHYYNQHQQQQQQQQQLQQQQQQQHQQQQQPVTEPAPSQDQPYEQQYGYEEHAQSYADPYWQNDTHYGYDQNALSGGGEDAPQPTITMPGSAPAKPAMFGDMDDDRPASADQTRESDAAQGAGKKTPAKGSAEAAGGKDKRSGWLGGILTKLSLRAPNQMILPDDTNPTIVWDEEHKRWRDTGAGESDAPAPPPPPPTSIPAMTTSTPLQSPGAVAGVGGVGAPPAAPMSNIFKMQKGRHIKKSYVDVLNPGGARLAAAPVPAPPAAPLAPLAPPDNYFIPAPVPEQCASPPVQVSIPSTPEASPRALTPAPAPAPLIPEGGIYDPSQVAAADEDFRSGI